MSFKVLYTTGQGADTAVYSFPDKEVHANWWRGINLIKDIISGINYKLEVTGRQGEGTIVDYDPWIQFVYSFMEEFGPNYVPVDIRKALNEVEAGCKVPVTKWNT